jgi:hypothetical protein
MDTDIGMGTDMDMCTDMDMDKDKDMEIDFLKGHKKTKKTLGFKKSKISIHLLI